MSLLPAAFRLVCYQPTRVKMNHSNMNPDGFDDFDNSQDRNRNMTRTLMTLAIVTVCGLATTSNAHAGSCSAQSRFRVTPYLQVDIDWDRGHAPDRVRIPEPPVCELPPEPLRLGFQGRIVCDGMLVEVVSCRSLAEQIGLVDGDIIKAVDGLRIDCDHDWNKAMLRARGVVRMQVIRCDCGRVETIRFDLDRLAGRGRDIY